MKKLCFLLLVFIFLSSGALATYRFNEGEGSWSDGTMWDKGFPPLDTTEELKITRADNICRVDSNIGTYTGTPRVSIANAESTPAKIVIEANGYLSIGEFRVGAGGATGEGSTGVAEQTGGTLLANDYYIGRYGGSVAPRRGSYTISNGTLSFNAGANGRLYVGAGNGGGYVEGTFTVIGSAATIQMDTLYVGSDGTNYGKGTVAFQIAASGVSPIELTDGIILDALGESSITNLEITTQETTLADTDIVLATIAATASVTGVFDAMNEGPAAEGTEIILADNIYSLTYQYNANGNSNDIALVYVAGTDERPHTPNPANGATLGSSPQTLSWINPDPNDGVSSITCTVYLGLEPNLLQMDSATLDPDISIVVVNESNFENFGTQPLTNGTLYYWAVACDDPSAGPDPIIGPMWSFTTDFNSEPSVNAGPDQTVWLGKSGIPGQEVVYLDGTTSDDGRPLDPGAYTVLWTQDDNGAPTVTISPNDVDDTSVTITQAGTYVFKLTADDTDKTNEDTVEIIVGNTACEASHMSTGHDYDPGDYNQDCVVDLVDFAELIAANWLNCTDTQTNCGN